MKFKVIISNGFDNFFLSSTAFYLNKNNHLKILITGAYPKVFIKYLIDSFGLHKINYLRKLLDRGIGNLNQSLIVDCWNAEFFNQLSRYLSKLPTAQKLANFLQILSLKVYARQASKIILSNKANIYHYRAGFGGTSVKEAKKKGMLCICDHSAIHPYLIEYISKSKGSLPKNYSDATIKPSPFWKYIQKDISQADYVLLNGDFSRYTFEFMNENMEKIKVINLGVEDDIYNFSINTNRTTQGNMRFLFAGNFIESKGAINIIKSFEMLSNNDWELHITRDINKKLLDKHKKFFQQKRVKRLGNLSKKNLFTQFHISDVLILPSFHEGSPRAIMEAMASGCFIITTENSGSIVKNNVNGIIVPPNDSVDLMKALDFCIKNKREVLEKGYDNQKLIKKYFRKKNYISNLIDFYNSINLKK